MAHVERPPITVTVMWAAAPHDIETETLTLPAGATVRAACAASSLLRRCLGTATAPGAAAHTVGSAAGAPDALSGLRLGLWGHLCPPGTVLQDQDRLELLRPLALDPMDARRRRLSRDGLRPPRRSPRSARGT